MEVGEGSPTVFRPCRQIDRGADVLGDEDGGEDDQQVVCLFPENDFGQAFLFKPRWFRVGRDKYQSKFPYRPDHSPGSSREQFREFLEAGGGIYTEGTE